MLMSTNFEILSENPLWTYDEKNQPIMIQNTYNTMEVIKFYPLGKEKGFNVDIPIEDPITTFFPYGTFFFKTEKECMRFASCMNTLEGQQTLLENAFSASRQNKSIVKMKCDLDDIEKINTGLYSISEFDELISDSTCLMCYMCYIDDENKIRKIKQTDEVLDKYIRDYCKMCDLITNRDFTWERLVFEVYKENEYLYINHLFINADIFDTPSDIYLCSRIMNYPICATPNNAKIIQILTDYNCVTKSMDDMQRSIRIMKEHEAEKERKKKLAKNILEVCAKTACKQIIINGIKVLF